MLMFIGKTQHFSNYCASPPPQNMHYQGRRSRLKSTSATSRPRSLLESFEANFYNIASRRGKKQPVPWHGGTGQFGALGYKELLLLWPVIRQYLLQSYCANLIVPLTSAFSLNPSANISCSGGCRIFLALANCSHRPVFPKVNLN